MKGNDEVIRDFNEYVNMTADELEKWLKSDDSNSAGWPKDGGDGDGESVGHDSGRKIVEILKSNPKKDPKKYSDDQITHMRKVASYCARHLAQEEKSNDSKPAEEVKKTKSYASLKNWGHDPLKKRSGGGGAKGKSSNEKTSNGTAKNDEDENDDKQDDNAEGEEKTDGKHAGDKRKAQDSQKGQKKEQKTEPRATRSSTRNKPADDKKDEEEEEENDDDDDDSSKKAAPKQQKQSGRGSKAEKNESASKKNESKKSESKEENGSKQDTESKGKSGGGKPTKGPKKGDTVSWNWGSGQPQGKVLDVKGEKTSITTKRGNEVSRDGDPEDPAVVLDTGKSKAIKSAHELN